MTKGTILVVDDDRHMVKTLAAVLELHHWAIVTAYSGEEAIAAAEERSFSAVLMDVRMPGMNGVDAFRAIHRLQPETPVILMTAYAAQDLLAQAEQEGALMVLPKPIPLPALTALLEDIARRRRSVLLIDGDPDFLASLTDVIGSHGTRVLQALTLGEALSLLDRQVPEVVVLDLKLEGIQPADAVLAIKGVSPAVALILSTGRKDMLDRTLEEIPAGMVRASLIKPFPPERLVELLDAIALT